MSVFALDAAVVTASVVSDIHNIAPVVVGDVVVLSTLVMIVDPEQGEGFVGLPITVATIADLPDLATYQGAPPKEVTVTEGNTRFELTARGYVEQSDE